MSKDDLISHLFVLYENEYLSNKLSNKDERW